MSGFRVWRALVPTLLVLAPFPASSAQAGAPSITDQVRESQRRMLQYLRDVLVAMVDSMPERLFNDAATPGQRNFGQQVYHAAGQIVGNFRKHGMPPPLFTFF
jgi:hypothetical protein